MKRLATLKNIPDNLLWCTVCLKDLTRDEIWLSDDMRDNRYYCFDCAPNDAIRAKDII